jgi:hypothetical protein
MKKVLASLLAVAGASGEPVFQVSDSEGVAGRGAVPVSVRIDLPQLFGQQVEPERLRLAELSESQTSGSSLIPVQFEPEGKGASRGLLWWLLPPAAAKERSFRLTIAPDTAPAALEIQVKSHTTPRGTTRDEDGSRTRTKNEGEDDSRVSSRDCYDVVEGTLPVLRYNHGTVPPPAGIDTNYARGDYLMPVFGPSGELLTDDYPPDHPHHRGLSWSWPVTRWGNEVRDIWAVRGVWSRPVALRALESGPLFARLAAENVWKWGDTNPIVREDVLLRVFRWSGRGRFVDVELQLTALADGVAIGGRPHAGYGGFGLRAKPAQERVITRQTDPPEAQPRRSWLDYSGVFAGGKGPAGLAIFEHVGNLFYPNALLEYPELNYVMPAFPGEREVPLAKDKPLVLKHRLWIHSGHATPEALAGLWTAYAHPPKVSVKTSD